MDKKIAVPVNNEEKLDAHFGHCNYFYIAHVDDQSIIKEERLTPPPHEPGVLPKWLANKGVTDIIAGGMGQRAIQLFNQFGVNAFVGAPQITAKEIVDGFLNKEIQFSANYCDH